MGAAGSGNEIEHASHPRRDDKCMDGRLMKISWRYGNYFQLWGSEALGAMTTGMISMLERIQL